MTAVANDNARRKQGNAITRIIRKFIEGRRNERGMRAMLDLGDHLLRDIGVTRFDIHLALRSAGSRSSGEYLSRVAEENRRAQSQAVSISPIIRHPVANEMKLAA